MNLKEVMTINKLLLDIFNEKMIIVSKELGITKPEADVLLFFTDNPEFCNAKDLVYKYKVSKAYVSKALSLLLKRKYIKIISDETDKRYQKINIEEKAKDIVDKIKSIQKEYFNNFIKNISKEEYEIYMTTLNKIKKNLLSMKEGI